MHIQLNKHIVDRYRKEGLSIDYLGTILIILFSLYDGEIDTLDSMDDNNKEKRLLMLYQYLHRKGFLEPTAAEDDLLYTLTEKSIDFIGFCKSFMTISSKREDKVIEQEDQSTIQKNDPSFWIEDWINIFPEGKINGRYLRTSKHECADRMRWFMKEYSYNKETIINATKAYINSQDNNPEGHMYTRNCNYFIFKGRSRVERTSDLATWCDRVLNEKIDNRQSHQRDVA